MSEAAPELTYAIAYDASAGGPLGIDLRDRLIQAGAVRFDGGDFVVASLDARGAAGLAGRGVALVPVAEGAPLWVVPAGHAGEIAAGEGELAFRSASGALLLSTTRDLRAEIAGHGHCGLQPVPDTRYATGRPLVWRGRIGAGAVGARGTGGPGDVQAMTAADPRIQVLVDQVDKTNIEATVTGLSSNFTRYAESSGAVNAQGQLEGWASGLGLNVSTQLFNPSMSRNVIAEIPGATAPEKVVVIGAHYDSVNWQDGTSAISPGADDNASGSAGVLEAARVLSQGGPYEHTLRFVWFSGEELGLLGAFGNAQASAAANEEIIAMLNMDMIAYRAPGDARDVDFATNNTTASLNDFAQAIGALYVPNWAFSEGVLTAGSSDHAAYFQTGFPATFFFEDLTQYYSAIHTANDTMALSTTDFDLAKMIVQTVVASAATLAEPVDMAIAHTALGDSLNGFGPYLVSADVTSLTAANVTAVDLVYTVNGAGETVVPMGHVGGDTFEALIPGAGSPVTIAYQLVAYDDAGGTEAAPEGLDARYDFFVGTKNVVYANDFEGATDEGWTHAQVATQDDWQRGAPAGKAGDPASAASGSNVWANDLGASGWNGEYQPDVNNWLRSPQIDASGASGLVLEFARWLTVESAQYDQAQIWVGGQLVWENDFLADTVDAAWTTEAIDVGAQADGNPAVEIEFRLLSDGGLEFGGWTLDDVQLVEYGPAPAPPAPTFGLVPSQAAAIGGDTITAIGAGLAGVASVTVGGVPVDFEQGAGEVSFVVPPQGDLADKAVTITNVSGAGGATLGIVPNLAVALAGPSSAALGDTVSFTIGAPAGQYAWLLYSALDGATVLPGLVELGIGAGNFGAILTGGQGPLNAAGNRTKTLVLPNDAGLVGLNLFAEGLVYDLATGFAATGSHAFTIL